MFGNYVVTFLHDTPSLKLTKSRGSIDYAFTVCIHIEKQDQATSA